MSPWSRRRFVTTGLAMAGCGGTRRAAPPDGARVVSQTVLSDEVLWNLGGPVRNDVVAVSTMADDARYSAVAGQWPDTVIRAAATSEMLLSLAPSLVILASFTAAETRTLIAKAGLRTLMLERFDGFADYRANVDAIATAVGAPQAGRQLVERFDTRLATLTRSAASGPRVLSWNEGSVPGAGTSFDDIATAAGYRNLPTLEGRRGHLQVSVEQLVAWNPDVIVVPCGETDCVGVAQQVAARPGFSATTAARQGAVLGVPSHELYSTGAGMLDVVQRLSTARPGASR